MTLRQLLNMAILASVGASATCRNDTTQPQCLGIPSCDALIKAGLAARVLSPLDDRYETQIDTFWGANSRLHPYCLVLPQSTEEVSRALKALTEVGDGAGDWHVAVRSGGHGLPGFSNIDRGVTMDLSMLNGSTYDADTNIASIKPGGRWRDTYAELEAHGVTVTGGRDGGVGVGGFLLGGGISFFSGRQGFGCDSVVNFEVVLADGSVVDANRQENADLWRALKGGMSNFGIVTRFDMDALSSHKMYYNVWFVEAAAHADVVMDTVSAFTDHEVATRDDAVIVFFSHDTTVSPDLYVGLIHVNTQGHAHTSSVLDEVKALPSFVKQTRYVTMAEAAQGSQVEGGSQMASATLTFQNDPALLRHLVTVHEDLVASLKEFLDPSSFLTQMFTQPIPSSMTAVGPQRGGNVLGLDTNKNLILWVWGIGVAASESEAASARAHALLMQRTEEVRGWAAARGLAVDLVYGNYADASQDVVGSYGGESVALMRAVSAQYDPAGVFQRRVPGGFKVSRVR